MTTWMLELRIILQSRLAAGALALLLALATLAVWNGYRAVAAQHQTLARLTAAHQEEQKAFAARYAHAKAGKEGKDGNGSGGGDAGSAAYYGFQLTWDAPSPLAFLAFGQRDLQPPALRVRMLGLHSQLYESENFNPELVLLGKFDFAFVLIYLVPLFVIALTHDWITAERESGRLRLLMSLPLRQEGLWRRRAWLRYGLIMAAILLPLAAGLLFASAGIAQAAGVLAIAALYTAFWIGAGVLVGALARSSTGAAATQLGLFVTLTLLLPTLANAAINRLVPVAKGVELAMAQRQEVHQGWDLPKAVVMEKFFRTHPEWSNTPPVIGRFHWKWYYAMHQVGDEAVSAQVAAYRQSMMQREAWTARTAWLVPAAAAQLALHRLADTDLQAQLAYRDRIAEFHGRLRHYFYPLVFEERRFGPDELRNLPAFQPRPPSGSLPLPMLGALLLATCIIAGSCVLVLRGVSPLARGEARTA
ncbi:ABC transporter permease [Noviherbaspirillum aerium]|uniref:ABC transporter permease n=1 Tax=Noviherbaspirillum aerium TaxID=2588497 RepID=UPI00124E61EA|nr:DUF3526 domain-containing protein [Noviherbaspirillum aerium]